MRTVLIFLASALLAPAFAVELPDTPAGKRLGEIAALMSDATPGKAKAYVLENYTPEYADYLPIERRIGWYMEAGAKGGLEILEIVESEPARIVADTRHPATGEYMRHQIEVEPEPPHRLTSIRTDMGPGIGGDQLPDDPAALAAALKDKAQALADAGYFSGALLVARDGEILAQGAWGVANRDFGVPNDLDTRFNLGSMNKTWTSVAIAQLVEAGKLSYDDPLSKYLEYPSAEAAAKIRVEHLLTHTSGLGSYFTDEFDHTARKDMRTVDDFLALSKDQELAFEPGTDWRYSNTGILVLGKLIESISGQDYYEYIQQHVLKPAGMDRSGCFQLDRVNDNLAVGYERRWTEEGSYWMNNIFEHVVRGGPAGGCYSTVGDLFRFAEALKSGRLVDADLVERMTTPKPDLDSPEYGYAFEAPQGGAVFGHGGGFMGISAHLDIYREPAGWVIVVLSNEGGSVFPLVAAARGKLLPREDDQ